MSPTMVASPAGKLLLLHTGVNSGSIAPPAITGWTKLTTNGVSPLVEGSALYGRIGQSGDTSPSFQWDASHQAYSRIVSFSGDVYTDLTTIVDQESERATNTTGKIAVASCSVPTFSNGLAIRGGHCVKTATTNGATFNDWITDSGIYTKIGNTQLVQSNAAMAAALWYDQQTSPVGGASDTAALSITDSSGNTQGFMIILKSAGNVVIPPSRSLLGVGT